VNPRRSGFAAPPQGGAAGGPAKPVPRRPLDAWLALCLFVLLGVISPSAAAKGASAAGSPLEGIAQAYLASIDGKTVWSQRATERLAPASLTKVMTALLVLERYEPDKIVTVSAAAAAATGTKLRIKAGERYTQQSLLLATLLMSANDACRALAEAHSGDLRTFVALMNRRAAELGLAHTHFQNACGHDAPQHYSTAQDLMQLTEAALANPVFAQTVRRLDAHIESVDGTRRFELRNGNELMGRHPDAIGVKSGYTPKAGKCLIALAERGGVRVLLVLLNAPDRWWGAHAALDRAFEHVAKAPRQ
jgi:serine-type D-Ala-D-Ala carboxypeptidase (penicillin-binding protein 5/6)